MAGRYKPYPEYKDSGVEWLGQLPLAWSLSRHKHVAVFQKGKNPSELHDVSFEGAAVYLSMDFLRDKSEPLFAKVEQNSCVASNDQILVIWDGSNAGEFVRAKHGVVSSTMAVAELISNVDLSFYWYACNCLEPEMRRHATGMGIPHVNSDELKNSIIPMPTKDEQTQIATFLDHEIAKIDTLIEKQQQLIQLLKEKRQAVISHAVTKGLSSLNGGPNTKLRDSGVEWLGEVPEHWEIKRVKDFGKIVCGYAFKSSDFSESGVKVVKIANVSHLAFDWSDSSFLPERFLHEQREYVIPKNALVFAMTRPIVSGGVKVAKFELNEVCLTNQRVGFMRPTEDINQDYLMYVAQSKGFFCSFENNITATNQPNISPEGIGSIKFACPDIDEQCNIVAYIKSVSILMDGAFDRISKQVELLQERRTALISAAVTGKIDVRDWVAPPVSPTHKEVAA